MRLALKRLLMVAYQYPPEGGSSGVLRTLKFSKYLPQHGWIPHVLTPKEWVYQVKDSGLSMDIPPEAVLHRTFALSNSRHLSIRGRHFAFLGVPDSYVSWIPFGVARGLRVIRRERIDALYSTSPPPTSHLIAAALKAMTGIPWIADFRDPWIEEGLHPKPGTLRYRIESALERHVVRSADMLLATTPYLRGEFLARHSEIDPGKARVIYNGFDETDFSSLRGKVPANRFEILHAGLVTPDFRDPFPLLAVLSGLIREEKVEGRQTTVTFLGGGSYVHSAAFAERVKAMGLEQVVYIAERIPHREVLGRLERAAVLLLLQASDDTRSLIPAKAFEYLRIGKPILGLTLPGATADLLREMEGCHVVDPADSESLRLALVTLYRGWRENPAGDSLSRPIWRYERGNLTGELALLLDELSPPAVSPTGDTGAGMSRNDR
jgi:glycosyltransferase involved in cell wall biosynthesis